VAFGFLGMGPVTIAVDSYGPVTVNAQSIYELSMIEEVPDVRNVIKKDFGFDPDFDRARTTSKRTMAQAIHSRRPRSRADRHGRGGRHHHDLRTIVALTNGLRDNVDKLSILNPPFLLA
jgi:K(+)-stimulated pyrophosphate-energized sodium pump